ncbi:MAG: hypothetical protein K9J22_05095, partial [Burkholderiaceae bacterium]|nr:hypothetical protein [Burkholderiaceae bacterium]
PAAAKKPAAPKTTAAKPAAAKKPAAPKTTAAKPAAAKKPAAVKAVAPQVPVTKTTTPNTAQVNPVAKAAPSLGFFGQIGTFFKKLLG